MADDFADRRPRRSRRDETGAGWLRPASIYGGAVLVGALLLKSKSRTKAQVQTPPLGAFLEVRGVRLHFTDIGAGPPVVFLHGAGTMLQDWYISGVLDRLVPYHRLIAIDRPGHGYSSRPDGPRWSAERQADAVAALMERIGVRDAVIVGQSWGVLPALALARRHPHAAKAMVLIAGAYFPGAAALATAARMVHPLPVIGPLARASVAPALARAALPALARAIFHPQPVTERFRATFPADLATRPDQLRASGEDVAALDETAARLAPTYRDITMPVTVIAGERDDVFEPISQSRRFADAVGHARLVLVPAAGHMVHHSAPSRVAAAIMDIAASGEPAPRRAMSRSDEVAVVPPAIASGRPAPSPHAA